MKTLFTFCISLLTVSAFAQVPTNFGSNAEDGITYQTYNLIDHGAVSSVRFMAQNSIAEGDGTWEFYTDNYNFTWRPYFADDTLSAFDAVIDPTVETASARYNANGGQTGKLPAVQAGYYYTAIVQDGGGDNFMSIIETDFDPVVIDTVYNTPTEPTELDGITITVELDGALDLSVGEHVFIRASFDGYASSIFTEVTNFSNGVGSIFLPAGTVPAGTTINYYALVTEESSLDNETVDYFTLFFGNNSGNNYEFTVSSVTGVEDVAVEYGLTQTNETITLTKTDNLNTVELVSLNGSTVATRSVNGGAVTISTQGLTTGIYMLRLAGADSVQSMKVRID